MSPSNEFFEIFEFYYSQWIRIEKILQFQIQKSQSQNQSSKHLSAIIFFFYKLYYSKLSSIVKENRERKTDRENLHGNGVSSSRDDKNGSRIFRGPRSVPFLPLFPCNEMIEHAARIVIQARNKQRWLVTTYQRTIINCADMDYANYRERVYFRSIGATSMIIIIIGGSCAQRAWRIVKYNQRRGEGQETFRGIR